MNRLFSVTFLSICAASGTWTAGQLRAEVSGAASPTAFNGRFVEGEGDKALLEALDTAFASTRPSARMVSLPLLYKRDWNGFVEGPFWGAWWTQNSFGATYGLMPFMGEEPYASWIRNSQDLWFRLMGDGKRSDAHNAIGPDGCLSDCAVIELNGGTANGFGGWPLTAGKSGPVMDGKISGEWTTYKQGDSNLAKTDLYLGGTVAGLIMEADRLLARHEADKARLAQLKRVAAFLDSRRDPETDLIKGGHNSNLLAPTFRGVPKPDGTYEHGYLTELSVLHVAAMDRLAEVCLLCGEPEPAAGYRAIAAKVRKALPRLMTPEGYFIKSEESDGRHGVFGAKKHGYFEAHPNHDAGAFRVTDDPANKRIVDFMLHKVKGPQPPGGLIPNGFVLPNYPGYDDHSGEGYMTYGTWTNGGVWPAHEGVMGIACFRAGEFSHPFRAWAAMRPLMEGFRADAPLTGWGVTPWKPGGPYAFCYDNWGPVGGLLRGLFEYQYTADGVRLWPHIPPGISRYVQKTPSLFGKTKLFIATTGSGPVTAAQVNGRRIKMEADGSLFLKLDGTPATVTIEFLLGGAQSRGVPITMPKVIVPPATDVKFWAVNPLVPYPPATSSNNHPLRIGGCPTGGFEFNGQIRNVRIYRRPLSEEEAASRANGKEISAALLAEYRLNAADADGTFPGAVSPAQADAVRARLTSGKSIFKEGGMVFGPGIALDIPSSEAVDFFEDYSLELEVCPYGAPNGRLLDRSTPGKDNGMLLDIIPGSGASRTLRLITPWGTAQAPVEMPSNRWIRLLATCDKDGLLRLFADGKKVAEVQGKKPVPQVRRESFDFARVGGFLSAMEEAGLGDAWEAGQARMVVELIAALQERRRLVAIGQLHLPDLSQSHRALKADEATVDKLQVNIARWATGGIQDHFRGLSLARKPVDPRILNIAKQHGLIP
jgi:hypothetical protein